MMRMRVVLILAVALLMACSMLAGEKGKNKNKKKADRCPVAERTKYLDGLKLSDEQKAKLNQIKQEFVPKFTAAEQKRDNVLSPDQRKASAEAAKAAKLAGKTGKEVRDAADAAAKPTDEQKSKLTEAKKELKELEKDLQAKVKAILTPEQQEEAKKALDAKKAARK